MKSEINQWVDSQLESVIHGQGLVVDQVIKHPTVKFPLKEYGSSKYYIKVSQDEKTVFATVVEMSGYVSIMAGGCYIHIETDDGKKERLNAGCCPGAIKGRLGQANGLKGMRLRLIYREIVWKGRDATSRDYVGRELLEITVVSTSEELRGLCEKICKSASLRQKLRDARQSGAWTVWMCGPLSLLNPTTPGKYLSATKSPSYTSHLD